MHTFRFTVPALALVLTAPVGSAYSLPSDRMLVTDPTGSVPLSDVVTSKLGASTGFPLFVVLTSDRPDLQQLASLIPASRRFADCEYLGGDRFSTKPDLAVKSGAKPAGAPWGAGPARLVGKSL